MGCGALIVADTHIWVWAILTPHELSRVAARAVAEADVIGISVISCWEVATLASRGRLDLGMDIRQWLEAALHRDRVRLLPITLDIATAAGSFGAGLHGDPIDRLLTATAIHHQCPLITKDGRLRGFDAVTTIW